MSWLIYTLLGVLIIVLLAYIIWSVQQSKPVKEGMLDYFTVEQYLQTIPVTKGQFVRIRPSSTSGDGRLTISQIQVIDMNGNNIALNMPVYVSSTASGSAAASATVDGTEKPRVGKDKVWTTLRAGPSEYWQVDLGNVQQISQVIYIGQSSSRSSDLTNLGYTSGQLSDAELRSQGMTCDILEEDARTVNATMTFPTPEINQTITFPNSINITPTPTDSTIGIMNPLLLPLNSPQPEVYLVTGNYTQQQSDLTCGLLGATVATSVQVSNAKEGGAQWSTPAWTLISGTKKKEYILNNPTPSGINTPGSDNNTQAAVNCFGMKPALGTASTVAPFSPNAWSQYTNSATPAYYGNTTVQVPDVTKLYDFVQRTLIPSTIATLNRSIVSQVPNLPEPEVKTENDMNLLGISVGGNQKKGFKITDTFKTNTQYSVSDLDTEFSTVFNPGSCLQGGPNGTNPKCSVSTPPESLIYRHGSYLGSSLYSSLETAPWNLILEDATSSAGQLSAIYSDIKVFGTLPLQADNDMKASIALCSKLYLGSEQDINSFINISYADLKPYIRANTGYTNFCKQEIVQSVSRGDFVFTVVAANQTSNAARCNTRFTTDMLGLLPSPARDYIQIWIYNRTMRIIQYKKTSNNLTQADLNNLGLTSLTPSVDFTQIKNSVLKMQPTVNGLPIKIDVTNNYILDKIAQAFYEAMGGNYIMSKIYDVFTIGGTIMDIRFDMIKHADISPIQIKIANLRAKYYAIRESNVSQDILNEAKTTYEDAVATLQSSQAENTFQPVVGVVGRFFYSYSTDSTDITINGFTLDSRAVTSFIAELNCGIQTATGGSEGALDYEPTVSFTKNIPEVLSCKDPITLRRIMDDYVSLSQTDLQSVLLGTLQSDGETYVGPAGSPSMDTTLGTLHVNKIIGAIQVSPTQCAVNWTESLWNDASNVPLKPALSNVTRNAIFSYVVNTEDWYANTINIDPSGIAFYKTANIPACRFDPVAWQNTTAPRLDTAPQQAIVADFLANGWNNGLGLLCPRDIPNYIFDPSDYIAASRWQLNSWYNNGGKGPLDTAATKKYYVDWGIGGADNTVRAAQAITPFPSPMIIEQPLPPNSSLDDGDGACPKTTCEDLDVLYTLADQYNKDDTSPGTIIRITRAYTPSAYQCDIEADINYNVKVKNAKDKSVIKGSFTYNEKAEEIACTNCPPSDVSRIYSGVKLGLSVSRDEEDCSFSYGSTDGPGSGTTIQANTPALYKPMEYASFLTDINVPSLTSSFSAMTAAIGDAANNSESVLTTYRDNTATEVGRIATLGTGCAAKCTDTVVMNNMLAYYRSQMNRTKQINTVLRMGTLNATTCDMTYQEDTLTPSGGGYRIVSSQTAGMRFTLAPDTSPCTFKTTAMTGIIPWAPPSVALDITKKPSSAACLEVYGINSNILTHQAAVEKCRFYGGVLATQKQLTTAAAAGASWSVPGYVVDVSGSMFYPNGTQITTTAKGLGGAACYGVKAPYGQFPDILHFSGSQWHQPGACATSINYVNPTKEAFMNYGQPVQITESTFPLNTTSFGLDMARNRGGPDIDTLFQEPLRAPDRPTGLYGPKDVGDDSLLQPGKAQSYKYIRFRPVKTRDPANVTVDIGKFRFLLGQSEVDLRFAKVTNPMGSWVGDLQDVVGDGFRRGFSDAHKKALVFAFPYAMLMNGFTWTTANPDRGVGGDPVQWKLEGSQNGTYWTTLRDQTKHDYPVPSERYQELPVFRF